MCPITKTNKLLIAKKEKEIENAKRQLYMLVNSEYVSKTIITINVCIPLPKIMTAGVLPTEIFERIFDFVRGIEEREEKEKAALIAYTDDWVHNCDCCDAPMTQQEYDFMEQTAKDEAEITEFESVVEDGAIYCGVECREQLVGDAKPCECCGDLCHYEYDDNHFNIKCRDEQQLERGGYDRGDWVCEQCVEEWESEDEEE